MLEAKNINSIQDAQYYLEGVLNDFESGISTKEETMDCFFEYTERIIELCTKAKNI